MENIGIGDTITLQSLVLASGEDCPDCGYPLDNKGVCWECGYKNESCVYFPQYPCKNCLQCSPYKKVH